MAEGSPRYFSGGREGRGDGYRSDESESRWIANDATNSELYLGRNANRDNIFLRLMIQARLYNSKSKTRNHIRWSRFSSRYYRYKCFRLLLWAALHC